MLAPSTTLSYPQRPSCLERLIQGFRLAHSQTWNSLDFKSTLVLTEISHQDYLSHTWVGPSMISWIGSLELGGKATWEDDLLSGKNETVTASSKLMLVLHEFSLPLPILSPSLSPFFDPFLHWNSSWRQHKLVNCPIQLLLLNPHPISSFCQSSCCRFFGFEMFPPWFLQNFSGRLSSASLPAFQRLPPLSF